MKYSILVLFLAPVVVMLAQRLTLVPDSTADTPRASGWMRGSSAPLRGALLGLLLERPGHGGELATRVHARLGETWRVNRIDVYRLLDQLEAEGLARSAEEPRPGREGRTRLVYHPTERAAEALTHWMETLTPRDSVRLGLQAKLAVARKQDAPRLVLALRSYERECLELAQLAGAGLGEVEDDSWAALCLEVSARRGMRDAQGRALLG